MQNIHTLTERRETYEMRTLQSFLGRLVKKTRKFKSKMELLLFLHKKFSLSSLRQTAH